MLTAIGLIVLPRLVWDGPWKDRRYGHPHQLIVAIGVLSGITAVAGGVGTVNWIWNADRIGQTTEALAVADGLAAVALSVLCAVLCFYAWPYLVPEPDSEREADLLP